jgi:hypothetical protein
LELITNVNPKGPLSLGWRLLSSAEAVAFLHHRQQSARTTSKNMNFLAERNSAIKYKVRVKIYKTSAETTPAPHPI